MSHISHRRRALVALAAAIPLSLALTTFAQAAPPDHAGKPGGNPARPAPHHKQPEISNRAKPLIVLGNKTFRDLNNNRKVDPYEDWRKSTDERVADLVSRMTLQEKAGLMLIQTLNSACDGAVPASGVDFINNEKMHRFIFRNVVDTAAACPASGTPRVTPEQAAVFTNGVQEISERTRLGIPSLLKSNARNHIDPDVRVGINEASGAFTAFPKEAGIAAASLGQQALAEGVATDGDKATIVDFAEVMGEEWSAIGLRGMYGYMADLSTEPRWYRTHETFTEDADLAATIMTGLVETLQGPVGADGNSLSPETDVALTMKHFPGGGPQEFGFDPHYAFGKTQVYPGGGFGYHLKPFEAAIDAGVSAIMPYYGVPVGVTYNGEQLQQTGFAFSEQVITGLLRGQLGFTGYVNSDTGIINDRAWGLERATVPERVAAAINGGTDTLSGFNSVQVITDLVAQGLVTTQRVDLAAQRLLFPMFEMGLFEDPYVDPAAAGGVLADPANKATGLDLQRKSLVLLQNKAVGGTPALPLPAKAKLFIMGGNEDQTAKSKAEAVASGYTIVDDATQADRVLVFMTARNDRDVTRTYVSNDPATGMNPLHINPSVLPGVAGLDGRSPYGAADACVSFGAARCTDSGLSFGGSFPWEGDLLDFTGMENSASWTVSPSLASIQSVLAQVDPSKVILSVYFRQPYVLDEASGLRDAGAIVANFGVTEPALFDVLSGEVKPSGRMPFALAGTRQAIIDQKTDLPGYKETADGELFPFGHGLTYP